MIRFALAVALAAFTSGCFGGIDYSATVQVEADVTATVDGHAITDGAVFERAFDDAAAMRAFAGYAVVLTHQIAMFLVGAHGTCETDAGTTVWVAD